MNVVEAGWVLLLEPLTFYKLSELCILIQHTNRHNCLELTPLSLLGNVCIAHNLALALSRRVPGFGIEFLHNFTLYCQGGSQADHS